jgi:hypothetical protein
MDLSKLNDDELKLLERILAKASGLFEGEIAPPFRVEFVDGKTETNAAEPKKD